MENGKSKYGPQMRYIKANVKQIKFNFVKTTDADILKKFDSVANKTEYVKRLIRQDIEKNGN